MSIESTSPMVESPSTLTTSPSTLTASPSNSGSKDSPKTGQGRWTEREHRIFLEGLKQRPEISWTQIAERISTRSPRQTRTHAQKYFQKLERHRKKAERKRMEKEKERAMLAMYSYSKHMSVPLPAPTPYMAAPGQSPSFSMARQQLSPIESLLEMPASEPMPHSMAMQLSTPISTPISTPASTMSIEPAQHTQPLPRSNLMEFGATFEMLSNADKAPIPEAYDFLGKPAKSESVLTIHDPTKVSASNDLSLSNFDMSLATPVPFPEAEPSSSDSQLYSALLGF